MSITVGIPHSVGLHTIKRNSLLNSDSVLLFPILIGNTKEPKNQGFNQKY